MGYFYFDETIHDRAGFILGAFVFSTIDLTPEVNKCLNSVGLTAGIDEFKSGAQLSGDTQHQKLRTCLRGLYPNTKLGLVVVPNAQRIALGTEALKCLNKICSANHLVSEHHEVYFDEGIQFEKPNNIITALGLDRYCTFHMGQDSRRVAGIQMADLTAHTMAVMLLEQMEVISKKVKAGPNSGYEPDLDIELGFEMWATLRYHLFTQDILNIKVDQLEGWTLDTGSYALHISESCSQVLRSHVESRFGTCYMGCIH